MILLPCLELDRMILYHQGPGEAVMIQLAELSALPGGSLSGLFSVTPVDIFSPSLNQALK